MSHNRSGFGQTRGGAAAARTPTTPSFPPSALQPTRSVYPPEAGRPDPDELIRDIPFAAEAFSDFQSVPFAHPPRRDVPSIIIAHLSNPQPAGPEPEWLALMDHFRTARCLDGVGNLQDLYIFVTRIVLPNAIIDNRRLLHELYMAKRALPPNVRFRYDYWVAFDPTYIHPTDENLAPKPSRPVRSVFRNFMTPSGANFVQWLGQPLNTPAEKRPCPAQLQHRPSVLDAYLTEDEHTIRRIRPEALMRRTARVMSLFWWMSSQTAWLKQYQSVGWTGIEQVVV